MSEMGKQRFKYWAVLFNPVLIVLYGFGLRTLYMLCWAGGVRRRLPVIAACGLAGAVWLVAWTICYLRAKKQGRLRMVHRHRLYAWMLILEVAGILVVGGFYGMKIAHTAVNYNGKLSWKLEEWERSRKVPLTHKDFFADGLDGILSDLEEKLELPEELYCANEFRVRFGADGTIQRIEGFLYGKTEDGAEHTYLVDYESAKDENITVWLDGYATKSYAQAQRLEPMNDVLKKINLRNRVKQWETADTADTADAGNSYEAACIQGKVEVYSISGSEQKLVQYVSGFGTGEDSEQTKENQSTVSAQDAPQQIESCYSQQSNGSFYYYMDSLNGWRLVVTDAAAGSRFYELDITTDGGATWSRINTNPFAGTIGVAEGILFLNAQEGYIGIGNAGGERITYYKTEDGGRTFTQVSMPAQQTPYAAATWKTAD